MADTTRTETWFFDAYSIFTTPHSKRLVVKDDTYIKEETPTSNHSNESLISIGRDGTNKKFRGLFQLKMPEQPENGGRILKATFKLYLNAAPGLGASTGYIHLKEYINENEYLPGDGSGFLGASWNKPDAFNLWDVGPPLAIDGGRIFSRTFYSSAGIGTYLEFDLSQLIDFGIATLGWNQKIDIMLISDTDVGTTQKRFDFASSNNSDVNKRPKITIEYEIDMPGSPDRDGNEFLSIEPNSIDPTEPKLIWKLPKNKNLKIDDGVNNGSYCIIRSTSSIQEYDDGNLIKRESSSLEYIDTSSLTDGITYYYRILICDEDNYVEGIGTGAMSGLTVVGAPIFSNEVVIEKPKVNTFVETGADYGWDVWEEHTVRVTAQTPVLSGLLNNAYRHDWQGDGSEAGFVELEVPANVHDQPYRYNSYGGGSVTPKAQIRNSLGFYSAPFSLASAITLTALDALAEIRAAPMQVDVGTGFRLRADESQDQNADGTITKYEFLIKRTSDNKYWDDGTSTWVVPLTWNDEGTTPFYDVPDGAITVATTYNCQSRVTGLNTTPVSSPVITIDAISVTAIDFRSGLSSLTKLTLVASEQHTLQTKTSPLEGNEDVRIREGLTSQVIRIEGIARQNTYLADILQLYKWNHDDTLLEYKYEEPETSGTPKTLTFKITRVEDRRRLVKREEWAIAIHVFSKVT